MSTNQGTVGRRSTNRLHLVLSMLTIGFLLLQAAVAVVQSNQLYPVTAYAMFSHPTGGLSVEFEVTGTTDDGAVRRIAPEEFGLTELQLRSFIIGEIGPDGDTLRPDAEERLGAMASVWAERHDQELIEVAVLRLERTGEADDPRRSVIEEWQR